MGKFYRFNSRIHAPTVRLIDEEESQIGIMSLESALSLSRERELDLVEVAPNAKPPVCKIMDLGKFLYKQKKQEQKQRKAQKQKEVKGIRLGIRTGAHDMGVKAEKAKEFLRDRNIVKVSLVMRGRELSHIELGYEKINLFAKMVENEGKLEDRPKKQGNNIIMLIIPN